MSVQATALVRPCPYKRPPRPLKRPPLSVQVITPVCSSSHPWPSMRPPFSALVRASDRPCPDHSSDCPCPSHRPPRSVPATALNVQGSACVRPTNFATAPVRPIDHPVPFQPLPSLSKGRPVSLPVRAVQATAPVRPSDHPCPRLQCPRVSLCP